MPTPFHVTSRPSVAGQQRHGLESRDDGPSARPSRLHLTRWIRAAGLAMLAVLTLPAQAVMLGGAHARSSLGQPLVAEIQVLDGDSDSLKAAPASPALLQRHGVTTSQSSLGQLDVRLVRQSNGDQVLRVTGDRPVHDPIVELLLRVEDRHGHIVRRLTLFLDPPSTAATTQVATAKTNSVQEPRAGARSTRSRARTAHTSPSLRAKPKGSASTTRSVAGQARSKRGAATGRPVAARGRVRAKAATNQPVATTAVAAAQPRATAKTLAPDQPVSDRTSIAHAEASLKGEQGTDDAAAKHSDLPAPRVIEVSATGSAGARVSAVEASSTAPVSDAPVASSAFIAPPDGSIDTQVMGDAASTQPETSTAESELQQTEVVAPREAADPVAPVNEPTGIIGGTKMRAWALGAAIILLAGMLMLAWHQRRRKSVETTALGLDSMMGLDSMAFDDFGADSQAVSDPINAVSEQARQRWKTPGSTGRSAGDFVDSALQILEETDPLAEADVYLTYGRADQARAILEDALDRTPNRLALHLKLATIDLDRRDSIAFRARARILASLTGQHGEHWAETCRMGRSLDPNDPLYGLVAETEVQQDSDEFGGHIATASPDGDGSGFEAASLGTDTAEAADGSKHDAELQAPPASDRMRATIDASGQTTDDPLDLEVLPPDEPGCARRDPEFDPISDEIGLFEEFADTSRIPSLPARLTQAQQQSNAGAFEEAGMEALELEAQAADLADQASESTRSVALDG